MKKRNYFETKDIIIYFLILIILVLIAFILFSESFKHYNSFRGHENEIRYNPDLKIESWMTVTSISRNFNIPETYLMNKFNLTNNDLILRLNLDQICKREKLNCSLVVEQLNNMVNK